MGRYQIALHGVGKLEETRLHDAVEQLANFFFVKRIRERIEFGPVFLEQREGANDIADGKLYSSVV